MKFRKTHEDLVPFAVAVDNKVIRTRKLLSLRVKSETD